MIVLESVDYSTMSYSTQFGVNYWHSLDTWTSLTASQIMQIPLLATTIYTAATNYLANLICSSMTI